MQFLCAAPVWTVMALSDSIVSTRRLRGDTADDPDVQIAADAREVNFLKQNLHSVPSLARAASAETFFLAPARLDSFLYPFLCAQPRRRWTQVVRPFLG